MARYGFVMDVERCNGCFACFLACKDEHTGNDHGIYAKATREGENLMKVNEIEYGSGSKVKVDYVPVMCQHCEEPECMRRYPDQVYKRPDGIVLIDQEKAKGNRDLMAACPYGAISWNEANDVPQKCTMCAHMLDAGEKVTRCSECCPNQALIFGDMDDPNSEISQFIREHEGELETYQPQFGTKPGMTYMRLPKPFICGEVVGPDGECVKAAKVTLTCKECGDVKVTETDFLGDFEFRFLPSNKPFTVKVEAAGCKVKELECRTRASVNLGEICLEQA